MAFRFRRRRRDSRAPQLMGADAQAAFRVLHDAYETQLEGGRRLDLRGCVNELFERAPTDDVRTLKDNGVDAEVFYHDELAPNWDELTAPQRAAKVAAFARLARALEGGELDPAGMKPVVHTKLLVLAWAHDEMYGDEGFLHRIENQPERFGEFEGAPGGRAP